MNVLILTEDEQAELETLNASGPESRQLTPVSLTDNRVVLNADLHEDCGPGQTWEHWGDFLDGLEMAEVGEELFPVTELE